MNICFINSCFVSEVFLKGICPLASFSQPEVTSTSFIQSGIADPSCSQITSTVLLSGNLICPVSSETSTLQLSLTKSRSIIEEEKVTEESKK